MYIKTLLQIRCCFISYRFIIYICKTIKSEDPQEDGLIVPDEYPISFLLIAIKRDIIKKSVSSVSPSISEGGLDLVAYFLMNRLCCSLRL